jgi:hypothetical protein
VAICSNTSYKSSRTVPATESSTIRPDGLLIRADTRGQPQSSGGKVVSAVRCLVREGGTAERQGEMSHVRQVPVGTRPAPPHHRIRRKRRHDRMNDGSFIG